MPEQRLPRYLDEHERVAWDRKLARILLETGVEAPDAEAYRGVTSGGDTQRLRGLRRSRRV